LCARVKIGLYLNDAAIQPDQRTGAHNRQHNSASQSME
jgi:hypothetical protein